MAILLKENSDGTQSSESTGVHAAIERIDKHLGSLADVKQIDPNTERDFLLDLRLDLMKI